MPKTTTAIQESRGPHICRFDLCFPDLDSYRRGRAIDLYSQLIRKLAAGRRIRKGMALPSRFYIGWIQGGIPEPADRRRLYELLVLYGRRDGDQRVTDNHVWISACQADAVRPPFLYDCAGYYHDVRRGLDTVLSPGEGSSVARYPLGDDSAGSHGSDQVIVARTFFQTTIPDELSEAAELDGCSDIRFILSIVLPLSKPIIAVMTLMYAVGHWNAYFDALIFLRSPDLFPLQIILRNVLILNTVDPSMMANVDQVQAQQGLKDLLKYSLIVVASAPVLIIYPFVQKHFVKGVMIGSLKG